MPSITLSHIKAAFAAASDVFDGKIASGVAAQKLHEDTGLNTSSARDFFAQYRRMLEGAVFKRSLSAEALEYFLPNLLTTKGQVAAHSALSATWKHIAYYEALDGTNLHKLRSVASAFQASLPGSPSEQVIESSLAAAVVKSQRDSAAERQARLEQANPVPTTQVITTTVFRRNPDVIAEVLARAKGSCEGCLKPAPFTRRTDKSPFLEVHHRKQLADGGHDTVANAVALCPNCHREKHHG